MQEQGFAFGLTLRVSTDRPLSLEEIARLEAAVKAVFSPDGPVRDQVTQGLRDATFGHTVNAWMEMTSYA